MKSLHVPFHFYPDAVGGTEVYALSLARQLVAAGHEVHIAAPGERREDYRHEDLPVHRFTTGPLEDVSGIYGAGDSVAADQFAEILDRIRPEIVHLHGLSPAISLKVVREIRKRRLPVVLTVHIPGILCSRGTMLRYGTEVCDGAIEVHKCSRCVLQSRGLSRTRAQVAGSLPVVIGKALAMTGHQASWMTALRMTQLMSIRQQAIRNALGAVDRIVAVSEWIRQTLLKNGVAPDRVVLCRHGVTQVAALPMLEARPRQSKAGDRTSRTIAFAGRLNEAKGVHVLVDALLRCPDLPLQLDIYGIVQEALGSPYVQRMVNRAAHDTRIRFLAPVENAAMPGTFAAYDAVAIPSLWMETGPLIVYDAFSAGVPVIGSRRGGIAELVVHERDGLLVDPPEDVDAWSAALKRLCSEPGLVERLRAGICPPRTMEMVAAEMQDLYGSLPKYAE